MREAEAVLSGMGGGADLKGTKLEVAVNAVVGALVSSGYLDSLSSRHSDLGGGSGTRTGRPGSARS